MNEFFSFVFLFYIGATAGWCLEVVYRKFFSATNPEHKWINPGCCTGPYLPIYGFGLCLLYLISMLDRFPLTGHTLLNKGILLLLIAVAMSTIEYAAGIISLKIYHVRLWDYSHLPGNIQGIICPQFSLIWAALGGAYYFWLHPLMCSAVAWLPRHSEFLFVLGAFAGIFVLDFCSSLNLLMKLKRFADEYQVEMRFEAIKANICAYCEKRSVKYRFFRPFETELPLREHLRNMAETFEKRVKNRAIR